MAEMSVGRKLVLKAAHALGLNIRRNNLETRPDWRLARFLAHHGVRTVLDVGANRGQFARELFDAGFKGRIVSFEALPDVHEALTSTARQWGSGWTVAPRCALSNETGKAVFHVADNLASSSLLAPRNALSREGIGFDKVPTIEVPCERLDDVLRGPVEAEGLPESRCAGCGAEGPQERASLCLEQRDELRNEPPRVCRRPQLLRGWGNGSEEEDVEQIFI